MTILSKAITEADYYFDTEGVVYRTTIRVTNRDRSTKKWGFTLSFNALLTRVLKGEGDLFFGEPEPEVVIATGLVGDHPDRQPHQYLLGEAGFKKAHKSWQQRKDSFEPVLIGFEKEGIWLVNTAKGRGMIDISKPRYIYEVLSMGFKLNPRNELVKKVEHLDKILPELF